MIEYLQLCEAREKKDDLRFTIYRHFSTSMFLFSIVIKSSNNIEFCFNLPDTLVWKKYGLNTIINNPPTDGSFVRSSHKAIKSNLTSDEVYDYIKEHFLFAFL